MSDKLGKWFHSSAHDGLGFIYSTADEAAEALLQRPEEIDNYVDNMFGIAKRAAAWGATHTMREILTMLVDVLEAIRVKKGEQLEP